MTDTFEFTLNNPLTEEQWDMIADVDFDHTDRIWFHTKHGKEVEFTKVRHGKWLKAYGDHEAFGVRPFYRYCSECHEATVFPYNYCPWCGARMDEDDG